MTDVRANIVEWAKWFADNKHTHPFEYSEGSNRMSAIGVWPVKFPVTCDCSAFVTLCYWLSGAADPNGQNYDHEGYTGTLISHGHEIPAGNVAPGDVVIYGPGTGWHTAIVVEGGRTPLTVSMGQNGDPSYVNTAQDGRLPQRFFRFATEAVGVVRLPEAPVTHQTATPSPAAAPQPVADLTHLHSAPQAPQTPPEGPVAAANVHGVETPATSASLAHKVEHVIEAIIKGPAK